jgi:hypothetical protein
MGGILIQCILLHNSSCTGGMRLHPTFSQKNEVKIPFGRPSPRCSWEETDKN